MTVWICRFVSYPDWRAKRAGIFFLKMSIYALISLIGVHIEWRKSHLAKLLEGHLSPLCPRFLRPCHLNISFQIYAGLTRIAKRTNNLNRLTKVISIEIACISIEWHDLTRSTEYYIKSFDVKWVKKLLSLCINSITWFKMSQKVLTRYKHVYLRNKNKENVDYPHLK